MPGIVSMQVSTDARELAEMLRLSRDSAILGLESGSRFLGKIRDMDMDWWRWQLVR
jgi:hypothetical protein